MHEKSFHYGWNAETLQRTDEGTFQNKDQNKRSVTNNCKYQEREFQGYYIIRLEAKANLSDNLERESIAYCLRYRS